MAENDTGKLVRAINGEIPFETVIRNVRFVNVVTREVYPAEIGIVDGRIGHVTQGREAPMEGERIVEGEGRYALPGLIDTHLHTESTMMTLGHLARTILPRGTTTIACDPHEIANVFGLAGVEYILETAVGLPLRVHVLAPSCVPAVPGLETSGATFSAQELETLLSMDGVGGLGEVMDYPGVLKGTPRMTEILAVARRKGVFIQGHAPSLTGRSLSAYLAAGAESCHETSFAEEARYKLRAGMTLECRESSIVRDIATLAPVLREFNYPETATLCTDDREPDDLLQEGHMDHVIRRAVAEGIPAVEAIRMATFNAARLLRRRDIGALTPGRRADIVLASDLEKLSVTDVFHDGLPVFSEGRLVLDIPAEPHRLERINSVVLGRELGEEDFKIPASGTRATVNVIGFQPEVHIVTRLEQVELPIVGGFVDPSGREDLCTIAVFERHGGRGDSATCLLKGFGLRRGAIASTVSHDSHNLVVLGVDRGDMTVAARTLSRLGGGIVCVEGGRVVALVELPVAGLISPLPVEELAPQVRHLKETMRAFGILCPTPLIQVAAFALPVIPQVRLTDQGLVEVNTQRKLPIVVSSR